MLDASTGASRHDIAARWAVAAELAEAALALVHSENAHLDMHARDRLAAEAERTLQRVDWSEFHSNAGPDR